MTRSDDNPFGGGEIEWTYETDGMVESSPTVADGTVYIGSEDNSVYALDAATGKMAWGLKTAGLASSSPTVADETVFVGAYNGVYALDAWDGKGVWGFETGGKVRSSPTVANGTVFIGSDEPGPTKPPHLPKDRYGSVYALHADDGSKVWEFETGDRINSSPTVANGTVYIGGMDNRVYALDAATGDVEWTYETDGYVESSPTVADGTVFVGSYDDSVYALDAATGDIEWTYETGAQVYSSPTVADGTVFVGSYDDSVYALDVGNGDVDWTYETGAQVHSSPTVADGTVFVGSTDYSVHALDTSDGSEVWEFETGKRVNSSPTVANGTVFVGGMNKKVYALDAGVEGSSEGSRAMLRTLGHHATPEIQPTDLAAHPHINPQRGQSTPSVKSVSTGREIDDTHERTLSAERLQSMDPYDFEQLVAKIWENKGYNTKVRQKSRDKAIDIVAQRGGVKEVIQVKRYSDDNKLGSMDVRKYATLYQQTNANQVVLITSGSFTKDALELARDLGVETINGHELVAEINQHGDDRPD